MTKEEAVKAAKQMAANPTTHKWYKRVIDLAKTYKTMITGENIGSLLIQFVQRETKEMFEQRERITQAITPAIASSIMKPFNKVNRNDKVKARYDFKNPEKDKNVAQMMRGFYGSKRTKDKGLAYWLKTRFASLSFFDPNAWIVIEWSKPEANELPSPHPFELKSDQVLNFEYKNEELLWLLAQESIKFESLNDKGEIELKDGLKYTFYEQEFTVVVCRVCAKKILGYVLQADEEIIKIKDDVYLLSVYEPKLGYVPAFRVGYMPDGETDGATFVNPFHPAMPFFKKSIKTVSELDLTMTLHVFPQKLQYVDRCTGAGKGARCDGGFLNGTASPCTVCNGSGYKIHTSAQDAILLPMPEEGSEHVMKLDDVLVYKQPPIELIKFQDEYTKGLKVESHLAVFNSQVFANPELHSAKTATEIDSNMESIYDTLEPYTDKVSSVWKEIVYTFGMLVAVDKIDECDIIHIYPENLKLKTATVLLGELKLVNDSGAPSFLRDAIGMDLAEITFSGDPVGFAKYEVRHKFFPFNGKTPDEIAFLISSEYVSKFTKVLYSNFEAIMTDIEKENQKFIFMTSYAEQWTILQAKVNEYMAELDKSEPIKINFGSEEDEEMNNGKPPADEDASKGDGNEEEETE